MNTGELCYSLCAISAAVLTILVIHYARRIEAVPPATGPQCPPSAPPPEWPEGGRRDR